MVLTDSERSERVCRKRQWTRPDPILLEPAVARRGRRPRSPGGAKIQIANPGGILRMHRLRLRWVIPFALAAIGMCVIAPSASAAAPNLLNSCKAALQVGLTPAPDGPCIRRGRASQSYLRVACIFNHSTGGSGDFVSSTFTIHDFANAVWHNGAARTVTVPLAIPGASTSFTVAAPANDPGCVTMAAFVNRPITRVGTGTGNMKPYTAVKSVAGCVVTLNRATGAGTIPANTSFKIENSSNRAVDDATVDTASPNITSTEANFTAADQNCSVTGTNWQDGATLNLPSGVTTADTTPGPTSYVLNPLPAVSQVVTICGSRITATARRTLDSVAVSTTTTIKSGKVKWSNDNIGMPISGPGITSPCYIASFTAPPGNTATLSAACGSVGITDFTIGDSTYTAPANGDAVLSLANELPLDPGLVKGSHDCSEDQASGFGIEGTWNNPGSFAPPDGLFLNPQPANTKAVAQILFTTSVVSFAAYVVEASPAQDALSSGALHYNVEFPGAPTSLALCASTPTSPGLGLSIGVHAVTASQGALTTGAGRPGTGQVRATNASTTGSAATVYITDDLTNSTTTSGGGIKWLAGTNTNFNRLCGPIAAGKPDIVRPTASSAATADLDNCRQNCITTRKWGGPSGPPHFNDMD